MKIKQFQEILKNRYSPKEVSETFTVMMKLYSPDDAVEHTNRKFRKW